MPEESYDMNAIVALNKAPLDDFCRRWAVQEMSLFGSALRDDFGPDSDLDFLVSFDPTSRWNLWDLVTMRDELEAITRRRVDLVQKEALRNPYRRRQILAHREIIHAA